MKKPYTMPRLIELTAVEIAALKVRLQLPSTGAYTPPASTPSTSTP